MEKGIAIIAVILLIAITLGVLLAFLLVGVVVWFPTMVVILLASFVFTILSIRDLLASPSSIAKVINISFNQDRLHGEIRTDVLKRYISKPLFIAATLIPGLVFGIPLGILEVVVWVLVFRERQPVNVGDALVAGIGQSIVVAVPSVVLPLVLIWGLYKLSVNLHIWGLTSRVSLAAKPINEAYTKYGLRRLDARILICAESFGISWPRASEELAAYAIANTHKVLLNQNDTSKAVAKIVSQATTDLQHLDAASKQRNKCITCYDKVVSAVNRTGQVPLIRELDEVYRGMQSADLVQLLARRRWSEYDAIMHDIQADLDRIGHLAQQVANEDENRNDSAEAPCANETRSPTEGALGVLGLEQSATNEQIKSVYKRLAMIYHPDGGQVKGDGKFKEIKQAYELLRKDRAFA